MLRTLRKETDYVCHAIFYIAFAKIKLPFEAGCA